MINKLAQEIIKKLDHETAEYAVRDITFLTCSIFNETHLISFKKFFNFHNFSVVFWYQRKDGHVVFYRSGVEYNLLAEKIGKKYLKDIKNTQKTAATLIKMSDEINNFIKKNKNAIDLIKRWDYFYKLYRDFFAYHQAVYWPSEYLAKIKNTSREKKKIEKIINILDKAYKYNEIVVPNVEKYFIKLGIEHLHFNELNSEAINNIKPPRQKRSICLVDGKTIIVSFEEASRIDRMIRKDYDNYLKNKKEIKGLAVSKGRVTGVVKIVKDLEQLKNCKKDDVLVTTQTRPQFNTFIKLVKAIVTDEGGYLCHASMLAREFGIPCIVGTKNATKILKNGDFVEVDANDGIIKMLRKNKE